MKEYTFVTYFTNNYVTLLLLSTLIMLLITNHKMKTTGLHYIWVIIGIVFTLTLCEAFEDICGVYKWNYRLLYFKTAMVYILYPLIAMLELYLVCRTHKTQNTDGSTICCKRQPCGYRPV